MIKNFVLDTNVLIHDIDCIHNFADNKVTVPIAVIEELDKLKRSPDERGRNARMIAHKIDELRVNGKLNEGVPLKEGGVFKVEIDPSGEKMSYKSKNFSPDTRILHTAIALQEKGENIVFITKDINLRIRAEAVGLTVQNYEKEKVDVETLYSGYRTIKVKKEVIDKFFKDKKIKADKLGKFSPNEFVILKDDQNDSHSALLKYEQKSDSFVSLSHQKTVPWGIKPLNKEQRFALELLLSEEIKLVTLVGVAGSGKTLLSIACGLQKTIDEQSYRRLLICRPIIPMGKDLGFLPGTKEEKLQEWMGAINDNLDFLFERNNPSGVKKSSQYLFDTGKIEIEALTYLRGRTLPQQYIIIDDAQNLTPLEMKTIVSRAGKDTKVILTGDPYQIDNPYLDIASNGLTYVVERFKGQELFGNVTFVKSERSELAALAAALL
ncbi:PhoH family protein [bacterium]|nr:PhoH family protein [bacterium]